MKSSQYPHHSQASHEHPRNTPSNLSLTIPVGDDGDETEELGEEFSKMQ